MKNIVLIGMPGAGKSTVGVVLAKVLNFQFLDADLLIQRQEKKRLSDIIEEKGIEEFRKIEDRVNRSIQTQDTVIATGGSVVYCKNAMEHLRKIGTVVYLKLSLEELSLRLGNLKGRGVVIQEGQTLQDLYKERLPLYEAYADITADCDKLTLEECLEKIVTLLTGNFSLRN